MNVKIADEICEEENRENPRRKLRCSLRTITKILTAKESGGIPSVSIITTTSVVLVLIIGGLVAVLIYKKKRICPAKPLQQESEMQPLNNNGNPIPRSQFRLKAGNVPDEDEYEKLNKTDQRQNVLGKSKCVAQDFSMSKNPLNRWDSKMKLSCRVWPIPFFHRANRILPYDNTRVQLKGPREHGNYINASWISGVCCGKNKLISAQSPLPRTVSHFFQMAQENNVTVILTLTTQAEQQDGQGTGWHWLVASDLG